VLLNECLRFVPGVTSCTVPDRIGSGACNILAKGKQSAFTGSRSCAILTGSNDWALFLLALGTCGGGFSF
jgi:hypothetical protein